MQLLSKLYSQLIEGLAKLAGLILAGTCLLIVWDVMARNLGLQPPSSTVALTEYALLYFTMAAAPSLVRSRGHIVVELLHGRLNNKIRGKTDKFILIICLIVSTLVCFLAIVLMIEALQRGEIEIRSLNISRAFLFLALAIGFGLMATEFLRLMIKGEAVTNPNQQQEQI
ncbi:MAG: TRAP transporter small permease subunit [Pseudomonadota bacterium]|nr:TRAP transporter small permease subunit [Pseudomonadota bacterium]